MSTKCPQERVRSVNDIGVRREADYVVYWMTAFRRTGWNFALDYAVEQAEELGKPLVVFEALRIDYPWASDRFHTFMINGMADNARAMLDSTVAYYPYIEPAPGAGKRLLAALAKRACLIVADDYPAFFLPKALEAAGRLSVAMVAVDSNGLLPIYWSDNTFPTAYSFRRYLQTELLDHLVSVPLAEPLREAGLPQASLPQDVVERWPAATEEELNEPAALCARLSIDHTVLPATRGGSVAAGRQVEAFIESRLERYIEDRNHPDRDATSRLSPYLHFGHISTHEVFTRVAQREGWSLGLLGQRAVGKREGWWGMSRSAEAFLDQLVTWRELGFNMCATRDDYDAYESLPEWALTTLAEHENDPREYVYSLAQFERAETHDPLWNAAQGELVETGRIHNYLRMLWGKKILEWTASPREALSTMIELNNKYALDGRDPNSYSGIFWVLGRYDRAWGPERPVFGKVRYMSSQNTKRKLRLRDYLQSYGHGSVAQ